MRNTAENKQENSRPISKTKTTPVQTVHFKENHLHQSKQIAKPERERSNLNKMFPIPVSYVSIQGDKPKENDSAEIETNKKIIFQRSGTFVNQHGVPQHMKMDRSKTMLHSGRGRGRNYGRLLDYNSNTANQNYINNLIGRSGTEVNLQDSSDFMASAVTLDKSTVKGGGVKPIVNDLPVHSKFSKKSTTIGHALHRANSADHSAPYEQVKSSKSSHSEKSRHNTSKDVVLPKPVPPSQQYLEGGGQTGNSTPWGSRSLPSPRTLALQKQETENNEVREHDIIIKR